MSVDKKKKKDKPRSSFDYLRSVATAQAFLGTIEAKKHDYTIIYHTKKKIGGKKKKKKEKRRQHMKIDRSRTLCETPRGQKAISTRISTTQHNHFLISRGNSNGDKQRANGTDDGHIGSQSATRHKSNSVKSLSTKQVNIAFDFEKSDPPATNLARPSIKQDYPTKILAHRPACSTAFTPEDSSDDQSSSHCPNYPSDSDKGLF
ncbi:hypothetical protein RFI_01342, partial [Reticulomyxa filosa]